MPTRRNRTGAVATALLASPLIALPADTPTTLDIRCSAAETMSGSIGRTVALNLDLDGRLDVAAVVGDDIVVLTGPDPCQYSIALGMSGVTAIGKLPSEDGGSDRLMVAHSGGLALVRRDPSEVLDFLPEFDKVGGGAWVGARSVVALDVDDDGDLDVVALDSTGSSLLVLAQAADGSFTPQAPVMLGVALSHMVVAPWGASVPTLAASMTNIGVLDDVLVVFGVDGQLHAAHAPGGTIADVVALSDEKSGVVGVAALAGGGLTVMRPNGVVEATVPLGFCAPTSLSTADVDGDGRTDVLLNSTIASEANVLMQQASGATFDLQSVMNIVFKVDSPDMSGQLANAVGADFDRDGDIDVFLLIESERNGLLQRGVVVDEEPLQTKITSDLWILDPAGSAVALTVTVPEMPTGGLADLLEIVVYTTDPGAKKGTKQSQRGFIHEDLSGHLPGDIISVWVPFAGDLGVESSIGLRCYILGEDPSVLEDCGVENAASYIMEGSGPGGQGDGTGNGIGIGHRRQSGNGRIPPPLPPKPIGGPPGWP